MDDPGRLYPGRRLTRAEAARIAREDLDYLDRLFDARDRGGAASVRVSAAAYAETVTGDVRRVGNTVSFEP